MRTSLFVLFALVSLAGCAGDDRPDAYGNIEATEVTVSAETGGRIETFTPREGDRIAAGALVGRIETAQLRLEKESLEAQRDAATARLDETARQIDVLEVQRAVAARAYERTRRLHAQRAATSQQLDAAERDFRVLVEQIEAARAHLATIRREIASAEARVAQAGEREGKGAITNPIDGTVLTTFAHAGEVVQPGQPLYRIADLQTMEVRAYITASQLASTSVGQAARVSVDTAPEERRAIDGRVIWISPDAEFTPTPIQTREERADLVYAVRIRLPNPAGILKIGMPVDVEFVSQAAAR